MTIKNTLIYLFLAISTVCFGLFTSAADVEPTLPKPYAPTDIQKSKNLIKKASPAQKKEVLSEFGGILYMGLNKTAFEKWSGREMSDCVQPTLASDTWCQRCEMITPHTNAFYSFYTENASAGCTLQEITVHINVADASLLKDLKKPIRSIFGQEMKTPQTPQPTAYQWQTDGETAQLYLQESVGYDPSTIRFDWLRNPLSRVRNAQSTALVSENPQASSY